MCIKLYEIIPNKAQTQLRVKLTDSRQTIRSESSGNPSVTQVATPLIMQNFKALYNLNG